MLLAKVDKAGVEILRASRGQVDLGAGMFKVKNDGMKK